METYPLFIIDAFTKVSFSGNSAAVVIVPHNKIIPDDVMQNIAAEMNLSETAFIGLPEGRSPENAHQFQLRWFTPKCEVPLCGHATLASASALFNVFKNKSDSLEFETLSGTLVAKNGTGGKVIIDLPSIDSKPVETKAFQNLIQVLVGDLPVEEVKMSDSGKLLVRLCDSVSRENLEAINPSFTELIEVSRGQVVYGVIVTLRGSSRTLKSNEKQYDFLSRYFAPWWGILEDPVTGSAHSVLAPYWKKVLNQNKFFARQCSRRGGELDIEIIGDRVVLTGDTVIVMKGQISI